MLHALMLAALLAPPFQFRDGERVVLLGNALIEHEQFHGGLETRLLRHAVGKKITFRNLGWSGDTVRGNARTSGYQNSEGMARLLREVKELQPTLIFVGYGMNESFAGEQGLTEFVLGLGVLLDDLAKMGARVVILSPTPHEDLGRPFPDPAEHNRSLAVYTAALDKLARERELCFVDLFRAMTQPAGTGRPARLTSNGILLNEEGYRLMAEIVEQQLLGGLRADELPDAGMEKKLRAAIVKRNELFYRRWRPFNDHSRHWGFMAKDFKLYDDEVAAQERVIDELRRDIGARRKEGK